MSRYIVVGSGISALGTIDALIEGGIKPLVIDIGIVPKINNILKSNIKVKCGKKWKGSFSGYGVADTNSPIKISSYRLSSSHQYGGFGAVWTGSCYEPSFYDLNFPKSEFNQISNYSKQFIKKYGVSSKYSILGTSEFYPYNISENIKILRAKIAISKANNNEEINTDTNSSSISNLGPVLNPAKVINQYINQNIVDYQGESYVVSIDQKNNQLIYIFDKKIRRISFSQLFICSGCINSLYLMEGLKKTKNYSNYKLDVAPSITFPLFTFRRRKIIDLKKEQNYLVPTDFVIIKSIKGVKDSIFCQISQLNSELLKYAKLPKWIRSFLILFSPYIFIAQLRLSSSNGNKINLEVQGYQSPNKIGKIIINEPKQKFYKSSLKIAFKAVNSILGSKGFYTSKLFLLIYRFIIGQDSCGWHMGVDLSSNNDLPISIKSFSLRNIHFNDSCTLNKIPSTTISPLLYGRSKMLTVKYLEDNKDSL